MNVLLGILLLIETVVLVGIVYRYLSYKRGLQKIKNTTEQIAKKNMETDDVIIKNNKELQLLASDINLVKGNLLEFVEATKGNVIVLTDAIDALSKSVTANTAGSEQTSESLSVVAEKTTEQLALVKDNMDLIASNNEELGVIETRIGKIRNELESSVKTCQTGMNNLNSYEKELNAVKENLQSSTEIVTEFNEQITEINSVTELVSAISEELNLLSLNASIEAAKAGESGRGFTVVAQEMNKLAEQTGEGMANIYRILEQIVASSKLLSERITYCDSVFNESAKIFEGVSDSFHHIYTQSEAISQDMINISRKYGVISNNSTTSREQAESVLDASQIISDSTTDIVAVSQETTAESNNISENVNNLQTLLGSIQNLIKRFHTGITPTKNNRNKTVKIAYFSKLDNYFWYSIRRGVNYAQKELADNNVEIIYYPYVTNEEELQFPNDVQTCIDNKVDAIIYPGFIVNSETAIKKAANAGIEIFTYNCDCSKVIDRVSCYAPDQREAGQIAAKEISKMIGGAGKVAIMYGDPTQTVNVERYESFVDAVQKHYKDINIVGTFDVDKLDDATMYQTASDCIKKHPDIKAIYSTTGMQTSLARAIEDAGKAGQIKAMIFDKNAEIAEYINKGIIGGAIDHDPFSQGHDPIIYMYNHIVDGLKLPKDHINCKVTVFNKDNINDHITV